MNFRTKIKKVLYFLGLLMVLILGLIFFVDFYVAYKTKEFTYNSTDEIPFKKGKLMI